MKTVDVSRLSLYLEHRKEFVPLYAKIAVLPQALFPWSWAYIAQKHPLCFQYTTYSTIKFILVPDLLDILVPDLRDILLPIQQTKLQQSFNMQLSQICILSFVAVMALPSAFGQGFVVPSTVCTIL